MNLVRERETQYSASPQALTPFPSRGYTLGLAWLVEMLAEGVKGECYLRPEQKSGVGSAQLSFFHRAKQSMCLFTYLLTNT